jgi:hypothetical protein
VARHPPAAPLLPKPEEQNDAELGRLVPYTIRMATGGQGRPPIRRFWAMLLGAGASKAAGLPLTEELLRRVLDPAHGTTWNRFRSTAKWEEDLESAFMILYPDGGAAGFLPSVAGFFTVLEVVAQVHEGRERLPLRAQNLLQDLRCEIAFGLEAMAASVAAADTPHFGWFSGDNPPSVVITTNWDTLIERAARAAGLDVWLTWPRTRNGTRKPQLRDTEIVVLKLHGSTDWGLGLNRSAGGRRISDRYSDLNTKLSGRTVFPNGRLADGQVLRYKSIDGDATLGQHLGFAPPLMATMAVGKQASISAVESVWDDAYWALSRAQELSVLGYSFPDDDIEIRSLLRVTTRETGSANLSNNLALTIINPSPDAHDRARSSLGSTVLSDYRTGNGWQP